MTNQSVWWIRSLLFIMSVSFLMVSCTGVHTSRLPDDGPGRVPSSVQYGVASWYGREFHGRPTASGEPYQMYELTAAHPRASFGTYAQVTNLTNGKMVQVRINDRGPFKGGRIIDLSYEAARQIDLAQAGTGRVRVEFLVEAKESPPSSMFVAAPPAPPPSASPAVSPSARLARLYTVQAGAYREQTNAQRVQQSLHTLHSYVALNPQPSSIGSNSLYRVHLGQFASRAEAEQMALRVKKRGYAAAVVALPPEQLSRACSSVNNSC